jgi:FkbM family methyltransferase
MSSIAKNLIGKVHKELGQSRLIVFIATKLRNQCNSVILASLNDGIEPALNGESMLISTLAPSSKVFIDVGANVGNWAVRFARAMNAMPRAILVEPNPSALEKLEVALHGLGGDVVIFRGVASDQAGEVNFFAEPNGGETSSAIGQFSSGEARGITVRCITVDQLMSAYDIAKCDVLKIDAEGFDLKVMKGASNALMAGRIDVIQFEYNAPWAYSGSTLAEAVYFLSSLDYEVYRLLRSGIHPFDYRVHGDYFGYSNFVAVHASAKWRVLPILRDN